MNYFPPIQFLCSRIGISPKDLEGDKEVRISAQLLRVLIATALEAIDIDCQLYSKQNPDLKRAYGDNQAALRRHFRATGYFEGRAFPVSGFDRDYYLRHNADINIAVSKGAIADPLGHYQHVGMKEYRAGSAADEAIAAQWRKVLDSKGDPK